MDYTDLDKEPVFYKAHYSLSRITAKQVFQVYNQK